MVSFQNTYNYTMDEKGRINIPSKFRKPNESITYEKFVITRGLDGCLFVYPVDEWERVKEMMRGKPFTQRITRLYQRYVFPNTSEVEVDKQGRITVPQNLIGYAKLKKEVLILGVLERIEVWDPEVYHEYIAGQKLSYEDVAEELYLGGENPKEQ